MVELCSIELEHALGEEKYEKLLEFYRGNFPDMNEKADNA